MERFLKLVFVAFLVAVVFSPTTGGFFARSTPLVVASLAGFHISGDAIRAAQRFHW